MSLSKDNRRGGGEDRGGKIKSTSDGGSYQT